MSQFDAAATPLWRCFTRLPDTTVFNHVPAQYDITEKNTITNGLSLKSAAFNFSKEDEVNESDFNYVLWKGIKGMDSPVPAPRRAAFVRVTDDKRTDN